MDFDDEYEYLSPEFDLSMLTVPRLRSILVSHDVPYPSSAKKNQLIDILVDEVLPNAKSILRERERVRRTSSGITNAGHGHGHRQHHHASATTDDGSRLPNINDGGSSGGGEIDEDAAMTKQQPRTPASTRRMGSRGRQSRATSRSETAETADTEAMGTRASISPLTASGGWARRTRSSRTTPLPPTMEAGAGVDEMGDGNVVDGWEDGAPARRRSTRRETRSVSTRAAMTEPRRREAPAAAGVAPSTLTPTPAVVVTNKRESTFSDDNPFQSGSSPVVNSTERRRSRKSGSLTPKIKREPTPEVDVRLDELAKESESEDESDDEYTPDQQLADSMLGSTGGPPQQSSRVARTVAWLIILTVLGGFAAWWRKEKIAIGYCGVGQERWSLADYPQVPEWVNVIEPRCEECPAYAFCFPGFEVKCERSFVKENRPLSLFGLIPIPPTCRPDGERVRRVRAVADRALQILRRQRAKWECGEPGKDGAKVAGPEMTVSELREAIARLRRKGMTDEEFEDLWREAAGEIRGRDEVVVTSNSGGPRSPSSWAGDGTTIQSTSVAGLPFACAARRYVRLALVAYRFPVFLLGIVAAAAAHVRHRLRRRAAIAAAVPELVDLTLDRLADQAQAAARAEVTEPFLAMGQLRDDVLRSEHRGGRRAEVWAAVARVVEGNANVRAAVREGRGGDVVRCWEWIGGLRFRSSPEKRGNGRLAEAERGSSTAAEASPRAMRKWEDSRAAY